MNEEKVIPLTSAEQPETLSQNPDPAKPFPTAVVNVTRMSDGSTVFNYGGSDCDVLGLLEFGRIILEDKVRIAARQQAEAAKAAALIASEPPPPSVL